MMKKICLLTLAAFTSVSFLFAQNDLKLWYKKPADLWTEALPLGNGRLGAMVFGKVNEELIQLNESTLWSGGPVKTNVNPQAASYLPMIRDALLNDENYEKANELTKKMQGLYSESYMPLGNLIIRQQFKSTATSYYRDLNIQDAIATTRFTIDGVQFSRQIFISAPDQVIVMRLRANKAGALNFDATTNSLLKYQNTVDSDEFVMKGKAPAHVDPSYLNSKSPVIYEDTAGCNGMRFQLRMKAVSKSAHITVDTNGIHVRDAGDVLLFISAATSFNGFDKCPDKDGRDENKIAAADMDKVINKSFDELIKRHLADYHKYFNRVSLDLKDATKSNPNNLPADERLQAYSKGAYDPWIEKMYFQFGRYLLISCSRPGGVPANLQGIWNKEVRPPWSSNYTININTQMNYWPSEVTNLSEMHQPLFDFIENLSVTGAVTAKEFYNMHGWVAHHNSDVWALSNPVGNMGGGDPQWANWTQGGNWLCQDLWEHYRYTLDHQFLKDTAYPLMKDAATFCLDFLTENKDGYLVTAPSVSPENIFMYANGKQGKVSIAATMDMSIIWDLFSNVIEASKELNIDPGFRALLTEKKAKLFPLQIGHKGNLQEWYKDFEDVEVHHRHVSHLFGLYPGHEISPITTPLFAAAAKKSLKIRGDEGTGWSKAWKINFWARLLDGNHAYLLLKDLLHATSEGGTNYQEGGGTYPDFFDAHPPFQIDGNFGGTAGMAEMLLQSQFDEIYLLPALPDAWKDGEVKGLKARGNFEVSINWKNQRLTDAVIKSLSGGRCKIRSSNRINIKGTTVKSTKVANGYTTSFNSVKGRIYFIKGVN
jgi:alpha-L-fucosidase 2